MRTEIAQIVEEHNKSPFVHTYKKRRLRIVDSEVLPGAAVLLISSADPQAPDPSQQHLTTGEIEAVRKSGGYAWAYTAHVFIGFQAMPGGDYPVIIEEVPQLSRTTMDVFLNASMSRYPYTVNEGEISPYIEFRGDLSSRLVAALSSGHLAGIDLIREEPQRDLGVGEFGMTEKRETLAIRVKREREARRRFKEGDPLGALTAIFERGRARDYTLMRVKLQPGDPALPSKIDVRTSVNDLRDALFVRRSSVKFNTPLQHAHGAIVLEVRQQGLRELRGRYKES